MLVQVRYNQQQKYVKVDDVDGQLDFIEFHKKVIERFCLPPEAKVVYKDATGTEVDEDIFNDLVSQGNVVLTVFPSDEFTDCSLSSPSEWSGSSFSSGASGSTVLLDEIPRKKSRVEGTISAVSAKKLIEAVLGTSSGGEEVLEEYHTSQTLKDSTRRKLVNIVVAHMIDKHGHLPTKAVREEYALGIVTLFPSLKDPYSKKGYEHFYDAASSTGYISWRLKTIQRKIRRESTPSNSLTGLPQGGGGPTSQRSVAAEEQLDGDACQEAISLLKHTADASLIFRKMRETFQHRQKLVNDSDKTLDILSIFPRFLDTKGLVNQDFILLFDDEVSTRLLQRWDPIFRCNVIKEAKQLTSTPELRQLLHSAESQQESDEATTYDNEMASLLLLLHLLPPTPGGPKAPKISASDAVEKLVVFHKSCCSLEEHLQNQQNRQPYLLAVGRQKRNIDRFYISIDKRLIPCLANSSLGAFDELFKAHFVFSVSYDCALLNFYTFLQTTVYNIDMGKMRLSPRVRDIRARLLSQEVVLTPQI